ncbi:MAG: AAA family ATPase [Geminicoccaceae bacterium]
MAGAGDRAELSEVVDFLSRSEAYCGEPVERIDTHISHVFLLCDRVYKMKRAVRLDFVDYSSLAKRLAYCRREIAANRSYAEALYRGVVAVTRQDETLAIDGLGKPVEWLVQMARFDSGTQFDHMVQDGRLSERHVTALADRIAAVHRTSRREVEQGRVQQLAFFRRYIGKHLIQARSRDENVGSPLRWAALLKRETARSAAKIEARRRHGFVRRIHGDMHLANICLFQNQPTPFDAIEFDDAIACGDVLYDLAFPLMDLIRFERRDLANLLLNRYLAWTRDYGGLGLLPLFVSLRAGIRAMATALGPPGTDRTALIATFETLAIDALMWRSAEPRLIAIGGLSGSGKSRAAADLALRLARGPGAVVLRSDVIRKRLFELTPEQYLGPDAYRAEVNHRIYSRMLRDAARALGNQQTVLLDATFMDEADRRRVEALAERLAVPFTGIWLEAPLDVLRARVSARFGDASDATVEVLDKQVERGTGLLAWRSVDASGTPDQTQGNALEAIRSG